MRSRIGTVAGLLAAACGTEVPHTNAFDPRTPAREQAPGRIGGTLFLADGGDPAGHTVALFDAADVRLDGDQLRTEIDGAFLSGELPVGLYRVEVVLPARYLPAGRDRVEVLAGRTVDLGRLTAALVPAEGIITGVVEVEGTGSSRQGVRVVASLDRVAHVTYTGADGSYAIPQLLPGAYEMVADKPGFTPAFGEVTLAAAAEPATAPALRLHPVSAAVRFEVETPPNGSVIGAAHTRTRDVFLQVLAFGGINEMRYAESPDLLDGGIEARWQAHDVRVPYTLSPGEGTKTLYAQFRVLGAGDVERLRTDTYATSIVYDATPPLALSVLLAPDAVERGGVRYLVGDPTSVPLEVLAFDPYSRVAGYKVLVEGAAASSVPYSDLTAPDASTTIFTVVALSPADGEKSVAVQLVDGAGNESLPIATSVVIDSTPPVLLQTPAVLVRGADDLEVTTPSVTLLFFVGADAAGDGPVRMRYGIAPAPPGGATVGFQPEVSLATALVHGQAVQFFGAFEDNAGNEIVAESPIYTVNFRGAIAGTVFLEGFPEGASGHADTAVEVWSTGSDPAQCACGVAACPARAALGTTSGNGAVAVSGIPPGSYQVRLCHGGYVTAVRAPVSIESGEITQMGTERLRLARGDFRGTFRYADRDPLTGNHGGITVSAVLGGRLLATAVTDASGVASLVGLPVGTSYEIRASAPGYAADTLVGVAILHEELTDCDARPLPSHCPAGTPRALVELTGDFSICNSADAAVPPSTCRAVLYSKGPSVLLGFNAQATHVRYAVGSDPAAFADPAAVPSTDACAAPPAPDCWNPYNGSTRYLLSLAGQPEGRVSVVVQFASNDVVQPHGTAQVVYDITPPGSTALSIRRGAAARLDGFTNAAELTVDVTAVAAGTAAEVAPLDVVCLSRDNSWGPASTPTCDPAGEGAGGDRRFSYGGAKLFDVAPSTAGSDDGPRNVYAWFCDAAGVCTASPVQDSIVLDTAPPARSAGRDILPAGAGITVDASGSRRWWTRSTLYAIDIDVGRSLWAVPEVLAYRTSLSEQFTGAGFVDIDPATPPDTIITAGAAPLPPIDGAHIVWSQFVDAAGNVSVEAALDRFTLVLDTVPPGGRVSLEGGAAYTLDTTLTVTLETDASGGATSLQYSWDGLLPPPSDVPSRIAFAPTVNLPLPDTTDGRKTLTARLFDAAGNFSERSDDIILDRTAPDASTARAACDSCSFDPSGDAFYSDVNGQVTLSLFASDNSGAIARVEVVIDAATAPVTRTLAYAPLQTVTVSTAAGPHTLTVRFFDAAGNVSALAPIEVVHDRTPPVVSNVRLDGAATWTKDPFVDVTLTATDASGPVWLYVSNASTFADASARPYAASVLDWVVAAPNADGQKTVYVRVVDGAGNASDGSDFIVLDATAPSLAAALQGTAAAGPSTSLTRSEIVQVNLTTSEPGGASGLFQMRASNSADFAGGTGWLTSGATISNYALAAPATDGLKTVYVQVSDNAGNVASTTATITLDRTGPGLGSVAFVEGAVSTSSSVTLSIGGTEAQQMRLTGSSFTAPAPNTWIAFAEQQAVTLTGTEGAKSVTVELRDEAGNASVPVSRSAVITLDTPTGGRPTAGSVSVSGTDKDGASAARTRTPNVTVTLAAFADNAGGSGLAAYMLSESAVFSGASWVACTACNPTVPYTLTPGDADKVLYAKVRDAAGNESNAATSNTMKLDTTPPTLTVTLAGTTVAANDSTQYTRLLDVQVQPIASDGGSGLSPATELMQISERSDFSLAPRVAYQSTPFTLTAGDGTRRLYVKVRDLAGNEAVSDASIIVDTAGPYFGSVSIDGGSAYTSTLANRTLTLSAADALSGVAAMRLGNTSGAGTFETYNSQRTAWALSAGAGTKLVYVTFRDYAGNLSTDYRDDIIADLAAPTAAAFNVEAGVGDYSGVCGAGAEHWVRTPTVSLNLLTGTDDVAVTDFKVAESANFGAVAWMPWPGVGAAKLFELSGGDGQKSISMRVRDGVDRSFDAADVCVSLDTTPPASVLLTAFTNAGCTIEAEPVLAGSTPIIYFGTADFYFQVTGEETALNGSTPQMRLEDNVGIDYVVSDTTYYGSAGPLPHYYDGVPTGCIRGHFAAPGRRILQTQLRDEAGNWSNRSAINVYYDSTPPPVPLLATVTPDNAAATLFWSGVADPESGIARYQVRYREIEPAVGAYQPLIDVDRGTTTHVVDGLSNRKRYEFQVQAVNNAGVASGFGAAQAAMVGWQRHNVASSESESLIPGGIAYYDGVIYLSYVSLQVLAGSSYSTLHLAVSRDGGASWQHTVVDPDPCFGRATAPIHAGPSGVVIAAHVADTDGTPGCPCIRQTVAWRTVDQGASFVPSATGAPYQVLDTVSPVDANVGVTMASAGGALVVLHKEQSVANFRVARSFDGGRTWDPAVTTYAGAGSNLTAGCTSDTSFNWAVRGVGLFASDNLGYSTLGPTSVATLGNFAIACNDPAGLSPFRGKAYVVYTESGSTALNLRENPNAPSNSWDATATVLRASGADINYRPAIYAWGSGAEERVFVFYRDTAGILWMGESADPDNVLAYTWVRADAAGNGGLHIAVSGTASGGPLLAYTDATEHQLYALTPALPAPEVRPLPAEGDLAITWSTLPTATAYQMRWGPTPATMTSSSITGVSSFYSNTEANKYVYEVQSVDSRLQAGEPGYQWEMGRFTYREVVAGTASNAAFSSNSALFMRGNNIYHLPPRAFSATPGTACTNSFDVCVYYSNDGGTTFTGSRAYPLTAVGFDRQLALGAASGLGGTRLHVALNDSVVNPSSLIYRRADGPTLPAAWSAGTTLGAASTFASAYTDVQVSASGSYVVVFWEHDDTTTPMHNLRYKYSSDYGVTWNPALSSSYHVVNTTNTNVHVVSVIDHLTIADHNGPEVFLAWEQGGGIITTAHCANITDTVNPTCWGTPLSVGESNDEVDALAGARYQDSYILAFNSQLDDVAENEYYLSAYVGGINAPFDPHAEWAVVPIDRSDAIEFGVSMRHDATGAYIAYATYRTLLGTTFRQLRLAYCKSACGGVDNWSITVLKTVTDSTATDDDFFAVSMDVDPITSDIAVAASNDKSTTAGADAQMIEVGGRWRRIR